MTPDFRLSVGGVTIPSIFEQLPVELPFEDITAKVRPRLISLTLTDKRAGESDELNITLDDSDGKLSLPRTGATIRLSLGWKLAGLVDRGRFTVDEVEWSSAPGQVQIRARSADMTKAFRIRTERSWRDTTLGAVVQQLAAANGLQARVAAALASIAVPVLVQHHTSDMALLRRLAREHDAVAAVKDGNLVFTPVGKASSASGVALPDLVLTPALGSGARLRLADRGAGAGVEARWHDRDAAEKKTVKVGGGTGKPKRLRKTYHSEGAARAAASAENGRTDRAGAEFSMTLAEGRADVMPETPVTLSGFKPEADAIRWIVAEAAHKLDKGGFTTELKLEQRG